MNTPVQVAEKYTQAGIKKVRMTAGRTFVLALLAGAFIALAGVGSTVAPATVGTASAAKLMGACVFPGGLAMVIVAGSELFTGNSLLVLPLLAGRIRLKEMLRNWGIVYIGNLLGSMAVSALTVYGGVFALFDGAAAAGAVSTGIAKVSMPFLQAFLKGLLCNFLVCIAVWMSFAAESVAGKIAAVFFPIMLFVLCGYEHSVANMYYIPAALLAADVHGIAAEGLTWGAFFVRNLLPVTLGNVAGGAGCVAAAYWFIYGERKEVKV